MYQVKGKIVDISKVSLLVLYASCFKLRRGRFNGLCTLFNDNISLQFSHNIDGRFANSSPSCKLALDFATTAEDD